MNVLSLFSGIGGLDLGLERAGMTICGQVEIDPWCRKILAKHWPEVPRHDDVRTCAAWWGERAVDVVCGGFPCQPVSLAGKRLAQADSRWLWPAFACVIRDLRPRFVLVENVPGLLAHGMGDVLGDLAALGYDAEWDSVPAAYLGAPHIRERVWIVAYPGCGSVRDREQAGELPGAAGTREGEGPQRERVRADARNGSAVVADTSGERLEGARTTAGSAAKRTAAPRLGRRPSRPGCQNLADPDVQPLVWPPVPRHESHTWPAEPRVGRVAHGIPHRVDRLRGLGNAVVPQVAEHIGRLIMEAAA